nr:helix-turn-helix transcriptional regulator [Rhizobium leguminosarum]
MAKTPSHAQIRAARSMTGVSQKVLAGKAKVTQSELQLLESPHRKEPDRHKLERVADALEALGVLFLASTTQAGEGVRFSKSSDARRETDFFRHGRALLDLSIDEMASLSGVGRTTIGRIERDKLINPPEPAIEKIKAVFFERGMVILEEEADIGGGVRFQEAPFVRKPG